jgi:tetratricopeptide (TPR) repeat protein
MTNARLEELRAKFQENPRRYFAPFANELRKAGDPAQAIAVCRAHLAGQPGHVSGHIVLGQALYEAGDANEARDIFTASLELDPENLIALRSLGEIAQVNGEFGAARQWYERLLDADPRNSEVSQLLKDMPAEAPVAAAIPEALPEAFEDPTPFTVRNEVEHEAPAPETPRSLFHTTVTGSGRAYEPQEPEVDHAPVEQAQSSAEQEAPAADESAFIDLEPTAHEEHEQPHHDVEPVAAAAPSETEALDMVDFDAFSEDPSADATMEAAPPDESFEPFAVHAPTNEQSVVEMPPAAASESPADEFGDLQVADTGYASHGESAPAEESAEPTRAMFAERGFDGPTDDEVGWMTTPSAALSDPEAAPEDWFDESASLEAEDVVPEASAEEPAPQMIEPDHATDSWFDEVEGAASIEPTEITTDELWLPPELPAFAASAEAPHAEQPGEEAATPVEMSSDVESAFDEGQPETVSAASSTEPNDSPESTWQREPIVSEEHFDDHPESSWMVAPAAAMEAPAPEQAWSSSAESTEVEPASFDAHELAASADEALVVEHPVAEPRLLEPRFEEPKLEEPTLEASGAPAWADPVAVPESQWSEPIAVQSDEPEPADSTSMDDGLEVIHAGDTTTESTNAVIGHTPDSVESESPPPAPFITETLAELYLQQGFREEALAIFRQLAQRNPDNQALADRIVAIEQGEAPALSQPEIPAEERAATQSVRTFFSRLARRSAAPHVADPADSSEATRATPEVPFAAAASALANLFVASKPPEADEGAASNLAGAFTDPAGRPSRAAERELSLDHLFRDVPAGGSPAGGVTLDEFYSTPNAQGSPTEPDEATGSDESGGTDIRQFTAWLEGLRKK